MAIAAQTRRLLINFIAFELGWFAVVLGAARNFLGVGLLVAALVVLLHLWLSLQPRREIQLVLLVLLLGTGWDSVLTVAHIIVYPSGQYVSYLAPIWITAVWVLFATTLNVSLVFLRRRYGLAALFGAIGAPLSFLGGMKLHALSFPDLSLSLSVLALGWALLMPILIWLAPRFDGVVLSRSTA
ncbi:MAG: DUF2878 domain-containing protein [Steroidobacteraceae bacterium]